MFNKIGKKMKKAIALCSVAAMIISSGIVASADSARVVTLGANLSPKQKQQMLDYFGVKEDEVRVITVNNQEERKYLGGYATEAQLGKITMSNSYVEPLSGNQGINVKTANLTWVTSSMIASTLSTAGVESANVVAAAPFPVSGTGALTGIMIAFETATGQKLDESKKELASKELMVTGDLGDSVGQEKAAGVINEAKSDVIKDKLDNPEEIKKAIDSAANTYNVNLSPEQMQKIEDLLKDIAKQNYDYKAVKNTINNVTNNINVTLGKLGENVDTQGLFEKIKNWFSSLGSSNKDMGILNQTNENKLGSDAVINATDEAIKVAKDKAGQAINQAQETGLFDKIINFFTNLFSGDSNSDDAQTQS